MKESIINRVKNLPPLSETVVNIQKVSANEESSVADMIKAVEKDPMITSNILKAANSPLYNFNKEITNIGQAISLFGINTTRTLALDSGIREMLSIDMEPYGISPEQFASVSAQQANLAKKWFGFKTDRNMADKLFLMAFLQEIGKIVLAGEMVNSGTFAKFKETIKESLNNDNPLDLVHLERSIFGSSTSEISAAVFEHWNFDKEFVDIIKHTDRPQLAEDEAVKKYAEVLQSVKMALPVIDPFGKKYIFSAMGIVEKSGYDPEAFKSCIHSMQDGL